MRTPLKLSLATLAAAAAVSACSDARATDADADLQRDLALASSTVSLAAPSVDPALLSAMETKPQGTPEQATTLKKASGPRAIRSRTPTVRAAPVQELAAAEESEDVVEVMDEAPAPDITEPVAVAPRPVVIETAGAGDYGTGNGGVYGGSGGGVIIRGGGVDGDNCELHRRGRGTTRGPIFIPQTTTGGTVVNLPRPSGRGMGNSGVAVGSRNPGRIDVVRERATERPSTSRGPSGRAVASPRGR